MHRSIPGTRPETLTFYGHRARDHLIPEVSFPTGAPLFRSLTILGPNISKTVGNKRFGPMAHGKSNGNVISDVT